MAGQWTVGFNRQPELCHSVEQLLAIAANCRLHEQVQSAVGPAGHFGPITAPDAFKPIRAAHGVCSILISPTLSPLGRALKPEGKLSPNSKFEIQNSPCSVSVFTT